MLPPPTLLLPLEVLPLLTRLPQPEQVLLLPIRPLPPELHLTQLLLLEVLLPQEVLPRAVPRVERKVDKVPRVETMPQTVLRNKLRVESGVSPCGWRSD